MYSKVALISLISFILSASICSFLIKTLNRRKFYVKNKPELLVQNEKKASTPGFGGISFVLSTIVVTIFFSKQLNINFTIILLAFLGFSAEGLIDDIVKLNTFNGDGITPKQKLLIEFLLSALIAYLIVESKDLNPLYMIFSIFYIFFFITSVNITDGLDGLSTGTVLPVFIMLFIILIQKTGFNNTSTIFILSLIISLFAFLIFNHKPAKIFMGDLGSQALGGALAAISLIYNLELITLIASIVLVIEFFSSLIQIVAIRYFKHKVFKIAPLHHLLEYKKISERKIVFIWTMASIIFSIIAYFLEGIL